MWPGRSSLPPWARWHLHGIGELPSVTALERPAHSCGQRRKRGAEELYGAPVDEVWGVYARFFFFWCCLRTSVRRVAQSGQASASASEPQSLASRLLQSAS